MRKTVNIREGKERRKSWERRAASSLALGKHLYQTGKKMASHLFLSGILLWSPAGNFPLESPQTRAEKGNLASVFHKFIVFLFCH